MEIESKNNYCNQIRYDDEADDTWVIINIIVGGEKTKSFNYIPGNEFITPPCLHDPVSAKQLPFKQVGLHSYCGVLNRPHSLKLKGKKLASRKLTEELCWGTTTTKTRPNKTMSQRRAAMIYARQKKSNHSQVKRGSNPRMNNQKRTLRF